MMKTSIFLFLIALSLTILGQTNFSVKKTTLTFTGQYDDNATFYDNIEIYNKTASNLLITWKRTEYIVPSTWQSSVCHEWFCWDSTQSSGSFGILASDTNYLLVHFFPNSTYGVGTVKLLVYDNSDPTDSVTLTFKGDASATYIDDPTSFSHLTPSNYRMDVYNILGRKVKSYNSIPNNYKDRMKKELANGAYIYQLTEIKSGLITTGKIIIQE